MRIVCLTSNEYVNCLEPFAHYWNRFAGADRRVTVMGYDVLPSALPPNFDAVSLGCQSDYTWSAGLLRVLDLIRDDVVLLLLEDYFLTESVDWTPIDALTDYYLVKNTHVVKIDLTDDRLKVGHALCAKYAGLDIILSIHNTPFQTSLQAALWRKSFLQQFLALDESAWQFEKNGTRRVIAARRRKVFDGVILGTMTPPMTYANAVGGEGHKPGVIEAKHMPAWMWDECIEKGWANV